MLLYLCIVIVAVNGNTVSDRFIVDDQSHTNVTMPATHLPHCSVNPKSPNPDLDRARCVLQSYPLIDGHNDLAELYMAFANDSVNTVDLTSDLRLTWDKVLAQTDIPRLKQGLLGAQFWSCWVTCHSQYVDAVRLTLEQLDTIKRFIKKYPDTFQYADTAQGVIDAFDAGRIGSIIGLEGGHSIDSSLAALRMYYDLGVRYMTVTHSCNTPWADNWHVDEPGYNGTVLGGLTDFGKKVILEMNRLGIIVDLSHVSKSTMLTALEISRAPIIFSHSSAFRLCNHHRNVQDDVLIKTKEKDGVVMVNFYTPFVVCPPNNKPTQELTDVADHIDYIKNLIGVDHVGIGADYDGAESFPVGLEDVSKYPDLFAELIKRGWSDIDLQKLAGRNVLRVFREVEKVRDSLRDMLPVEGRLPWTDLVDTKCRTAS